MRTESAPLLRGGDDDPPQSAQSRPSMSHRIANVVQEPLTGLTKVLLVEVLILLLISSVFIGLFAGAQHKLNLRNGIPGDGGGGGGKSNTTLTETKTATSTATATATSTATITHTTTAAVSTIISGIVTTTTAVSTAFSTVFDSTTTTKTATATATKTSVSTSISTYTTTDVHTRTVIVGPEPTGPPQEPSPPPSVGLLARV